MRISRPLIILATTALVLTACNGGDETADEPTPTPTESPSPTASPSPSPTEVGPSPSPTPSPTETNGVDPASQVPAIAATCTIEDAAGEADSVRIAYPEGWLVQDGCEWFDPDAEQVAEDTQPSVAVSWRVESVAFEDAADVKREVRDPIRYVGARSAYQAVRIEGESTGAGLRPEGEPVLMWLVDLDPGTDEQGGTLIGTAHGSDGAPFPIAAYALDRMADTMLVQPPASEQFVVTRLEGGGTPVTVTWAQDDGCFLLRTGGPEGEIADEACVEGALGSSGLTPMLLEDGDTRILAGLSAPQIQRITVPAASTLSGGTTQSTEGANLFALPVREPPFEVTGHDYTGEVVTTVTFEG